MYRDARGLLLRAIQWKIGVEFLLGLLYYAVGLQTTHVKTISLILNLILFYWFVVNPLQGAANKEIIVEKELREPLYESQCIIFCCLSAIVFFETIDYEAIYRKGPWTWEFEGSIVFKFIVLYVCILVFYVYSTKHKRVFGAIQEEYGEEIVYSHRPRPY